MNLYICRDVSHLRKTCQGLAGKVWRGAQREKRDKQKIASTDFTENLESLENLEHPESANKKNANRMQHSVSVYYVPRAGAEPARVAPLVFETSASTDSAIWA